MKKIKLLLLLVCCMLTGCREYGEKRIVSTVVADKEAVAVYYYDFTGDKPDYQKEERYNQGLKSTLTEILSQNDYSLKLCRYAVVSEDIIAEGVDKIFYALTDNRFALDMVIIEGDTGLDAEEYEKIDKNGYPIYNYSFSNIGVDAVIENMSSDEKKLIVENKVYRQLNPSQSFVFDIVNNTENDGIYTIISDKTTIMAQLDKINTFYCIQNAELNINITAILKSYKGMPSDRKTKEYVCSQLEKDIEYQTKTLLEDKIITDRFDLLWYRQAGKYEDVKINVNVM